MILQRKTPGAASVDNSKALNRDVRPSTRDFNNKFIKAKREHSPPHLVFESRRLEEALPNVQLKFLILKLLN